MLRHSLVNQRGFALIITLFVVTLVTILVLEYHFDAQIELELAVANGEDVQAYYLALSTVNLVRAVLAQDDPSSDGPQDPWAQVALLNGACITPHELLSMAASAAAAGGAGTGSSIVGPGFVPGSLEALKSPFSPGADLRPPQDAATASAQEGCVSLSITDESAKLPLNALLPQGPPQGNGQPQPNPEWKAIFEEFFDSFQISPDIVQAIVDWIDPDDNRFGSEGAESSDYAGLEKPYEAANKPLRSPGELRLIKGFHLPENLALLCRVPVEEVRDIDIATNEYLTVYGAVPPPTPPQPPQPPRPPRRNSPPPNPPTSSAGNAAKVNLNTAKPEVLHAIFAGLTGRTDGRGGVDTIVNDIIATRAEKQCTQINECVPSPPATLTNVADVKSTHFQVIAEGRVGTGANPVTKRIIAVIERQTSATAPKIVYFKVE